MISINNLSLNLERVASRVTSENVELLRKKNYNVLELFGIPKRDLPEDTMEVMKDFLLKQKVAPSCGIPELKEEISRVIFEETGVSIDPEKNVIITNGAMHALNITFSTILTPGDEVIIFAPCFFFGGIIEKAGGVPVYINLKEDTGFKYDFKKLCANITGKTKAIILNSPANPTGYVATHEDINELARIAEKYNLFIVTDESYYTMIYDGLRNISMLEKENIRDRVILIRSFTKTYAMPGWRVGFIIAENEISNGLKKILEWDVLFGNYFTQKVAEHVIKNSYQWVNKTSSEFQINRDILFKSIIDKSNIFHAVKPKGGPFLFLNVSKINLNCEKISKILLENFGIQAEAGTYFKSKKHVRIMFGGEEQTLLMLIRRLRDAEEYFLKEGKVNL